MTRESELFRILLLLFIKQAFFFFLNCEIEELLRQVLLLNTSDTGPEPNTCHYEVS